jgi:hypothetical protein
MCDTSIYVPLCICFEECYPYRLKIHLMMTVNVSMFILQISEWTQRVLVKLLYFTGKNISRNDCTAEAGMVKQLSRVVGWRE